MKDALYLLLFWATFYSFNILSIMESILNLKDLYILNIKLFVSES